MFRPRLQDSQPIADARLGYCQFIFTWRQKRCTRCVCENKLHVQWLHVSFGKKHWENLMATFQQKKKNSVFRIHYSLFPGWLQPYFPQSQSVQDHFRICWPYLVILMQTWFTVAELQRVHLLVWENFSRAMRANSMTVGWASELWKDRKWMLALVVFESTKFTRKKDTFYVNGNYNKFPSSQEFCFNLISHLDWLRKSMSYQKISFAKVRQRENRCSCFNSTLIEKSNII